MPTEHGRGQHSPGSGGRRCREWWEGHGPGGGWWWGAWLKAGVRVPWFFPRFCPRLASRTREREVTPSLVTLVAWVQVDKAHTGVILFHSSSNPTGSVCQLHLPDRGTKAQEREMACSRAGSGIGTWASASAAHGPGGVWMPASQYPQGGGLWAMVRIPGILRDPLVCTPWPSPVTYPWHSWDGPPRVPSPLRPPKPRSQASRPGCDSVDN